MLFPCLYNQVNVLNVYSFDIGMDNIDRSYIMKGEDMSTHLNRNKAMINIIKLIIKTTVIITLICVFVKAKKKKKNQIFVFSFVYLMYL